MFITIMTLTPNLHFSKVVYLNLLKISPPSKIRPPPFLNEVVAKGAFLSKVHPPIYATVHAVMLSKKH